MRTAWCWKRMQVGARASCCRAWGWLGAGVFEAAVASALASLPVPALSPRPRLHTCPTGSPARPADLPVRQPLCALVCVPPSCLLADAADLSVPLHTLQSTIAQLRNPTAPLLPPAPTPPPQPATAKLRRRQAALLRPANSGGGDADGSDYAAALGQRLALVLAAAADDVSAVFGSAHAELSAAFLVWALQQTERWVQSFPEWAASGASDRLCWPC